MEQDEPIDTSIRYLFSIDGRTTWFSIKNGVSQAVDVNDILTDGMTKDEIESINNYEFGSTVNLDVMVGLNTQNELSTPVLKSITIQY